MSNKEIKSPNNSGIKILNDEQSVQKSPNTVIKTSPQNAKKKKISGKDQKQDHYVLQTIKGENGDEHGAEGETISFVLAKKHGKRHNDTNGISTEDISLDAEENSGIIEGGDDKPEEIVEHVCGKCYKSFRRFSGLKKHLDFCRFDSGYHLRKAEMLKNLEKIEKDAVHMENKDICFCCGESYDTFHLGHINCPDCPKSFKSQTSYERHIFITHSECDDYPCTICNAKLRSENLLKLHIEQHQNRGKPYACKICGKDFTRSYHLKRHQKYSSCSANEGDTMSCKVCNKSFFRLDNLRAHLKQHLGNHVTKKAEYMCPICKNCFYSLSTLNIHTRTHTGERPFDCDLCEKKFPSLVALKKHRRYHTGEKPYTCTVCNQSFAVKEVLNRHMKRHTGERPHVCPDCNKSFIQATQLRSHAKTHIRPYACDVCEEKFKTEKQMLRHSKTHKSNRRSQKSEFEFRCNECKAAFRTESQLEKHKLVGKHIGKRKAKERTDCAICEKNFDTAKNLHFHILKVHEVDPEEFINQKSSDETTIIIHKPKMIKLDKGEEDNSGSSDSKAKRNEKSKLDNITDDDIAKGVVVEEFIVNELPTGSAEPEEFTVIPLEEELLELNGSDGEVESSNTPESKRGLRKSLAESLAAAIADEDVPSGNDDGKEINNEDIKFKENIGKLLDMLVDADTLQKFGWPKTSEEMVLCKVIENCGYDLSKDTENFKDCDYGTRMREYVKLMFAVVIHNDSIKELLNNYPIDEVIEYVLGNEDDDDGNDCNEDDGGDNADDNNMKKEDDEDDDDENDNANTDVTDSDKDYEVEDDDEEDD